MSKLSARKTRLVFETSCLIWSQGANRAVIVEAQAARAAEEKTARAKGELAAFHLSAKKAGRR
jgi:hypothetical protein